MNIDRKSNDEQALHWNTGGGCAWVEAQALLDQILQPFEDLLLECLGAAAGARVLDVGCGTGSTTLAAARAVGAKGRSVGIDISQPMIAVARARAEREHNPATFIADDAQTHAFDGDGFDAIISRFGVMFFEDPVRAFANLRHAASNGARLHSVTWRGPAENPFMTTAERAAAPLLPNIPPRQPNAPGQFAFADSHRVQGILEQSGWSEIDIRPVDVACWFPESALVPFMTRLGPLGRALDGVDDQVRSRIVETVRGAFDPFVHGAEVRFTAACWLMNARALRSP